ncbi:hypothetical protein ACP6C7_18870 [Mycolicibacterium septicum]|uniref:Uncharacterized protein n=1 Tax=Mycolicibacterium septicum TaxID=98668 RepID=A0ABW9LSZ1_9MYCO
MSEVVVSVDIPKLTEEGLNVALDLIQSAADYIRYSHDELSRAGITGYREFFRLLGAVPEETEE